jgi:hypothetical protein
VYREWAGTFPYARNTRYVTIHDNTQNMDC